MTAPEHDRGMSLDWTCTSEHREINRALDYWRSKQKDGALPRRGDISPAELRDILPIIHLYDVFDRGRSFRPRLIGTRISAAFDENNTGKVFDASAPDHLLIQRMLNVFGQVVQRCAPVIARAGRTAVDRMNLYGVESIFLPLAENGSDVDTVQVATMFDATPYWGVN